MVFTWSIFVFYQLNFRQVYWNVLWLQCILVQIVVELKRQIFEGYFRNLVSKCLPKVLDLDDIERGHYCSPWKSNRSLPAKKEFDYFHWHIFKTGTYLVCRYEFLDVFYWYICTDYAKNVGHTYLQKNEIDPFTYKVDKKWFWLNRKWILQYDFSGQKLAL